MKKLLFIVITALFLNSCGGPKLPDGFTPPTTPPDPNLMQPSGNPTE